MGRGSSGQDGSTGRNGSPLHTTTSKLQLKWEGEDGSEIGGSRVHFPSAPVKCLADLRNRANSQRYSSICEDWRPKIEDIERSDGETIKPGVLKRLELDRVKPINVRSRPVSTGD